ncbi:MAG: glycosyltransferase family 4 protein [Thermomicrobiales bacterium]
MARIAIDARMCGYRQGGIASYTRQLTAALAPLLTARGDTLIVGRARRGGTVLPGQPGQQETRLWTPPHHRFERWTLPIEWLRTRCDLLHTPDFLPVRPGPWRTVITVHDLDFLRHPDRLTAEAQRYYGRIYWAVHHADAIIAVSQATRDDLVNLTGADPCRITVIHEAADARFRPGNRAASSVDSLLDVAGTRIPTPFFLFVGTIEPRKNLDTLLDAYAAYRQSSPAASHLVIAGAAGWNSARTVARLKTEPGVTWLDPAETSTLVALYQHATALLLPSWDEGFGLPVVEAMASGTPVAISNAAALVEIAGDAALVAPANDPRAWTALLATLATDDAKRAAMRARGLTRAAHFSWERAAHETANVYTRVLAESRRTHHERNSSAS